MKTRVITIPITIQSEDFEEDFEPMGGFDAAIGVVDARTTYLIKGGGDESVFEQDENSLTYKSYGPLDIDRAIAHTGPGVLFTVKEMRRHSDLLLRLKAAGENLQRVAREGTIMELLDAIDDFNRNAWIVSDDENEFFWRGEDS